MNESTRSIVITAFFTIILSIVSNAISSMIIGDISLTSFLLITGISVCLFFVVIFMPFFRMLFITRSGLIDFKEMITPAQCADKYLPGVKREFMYFGVTGNSIKDPVKKFMLQESGYERIYRFLLMKPDGEAFRAQIAFQKGYDSKSLTADHERILDAEVKAEKQSFDAFIAAVQSTPAYMNSPRRAEIKTFDEITPWWGYVIDAKNIVLGLIVSNSGKAGDPIVVLKKNEKDKVNLFSAFSRNIDRLWNNATPQ
jgi:hypothetical protein